MSDPMEIFPSFFFFKIVITGHLELQKTCFLYALIFVHWKHRTQESMESHRAKPILQLPKEMITWQIHETNIMKAYFLFPRQIWRFFIQMLGCWWVFQPKKRCFKVWTPDTPDASKSLTTGRVGGSWRSFITEFGSSQSGWFSKHPILVVV